MKINSFKHKLTKFWKALQLLSNKQKKTNKENKRSNKDLRNKKHLNIKRKKREEMELQFLLKPLTKDCQPLGFL